MISVPDKSKSGKSTVNLKDEIKFSHLIIILTIPSQSKLVTFDLLFNLIILKMDSTFLLLLQYGKWNNS